MTRITVTTIFFGIVACLSTVTSVFAAETVRLQLKWQHQFQFAGYYAARHLGYYRDAGLDVELLEAKPGVNTTETVLQGKAEYGVGNSGLLLSKMPAHRWSYWPSSCNTPHSSCSHVKRPRSMALRIWQESV